MKAATNRLSSTLMLSAAISKINYLIPLRSPNTESGHPVIADEIEVLLDYDSLDIEFAISGKGQVHILRVRPIAVDHAQWNVSDEDVDALLSGVRSRFRDL